MKANVSVKRNVQYILWFLERPSCMWWIIRNVRVAIQNPYTTSKEGCGESSILLVARGPPMQFVTKIKKTAKSSFIKFATLHILERGWGKGPRKRYYYGSPVEGREFYKRWTIRPAEKQDNQSPNNSLVGPYMFKNSRIYIYIFFSYAQLEKNMLQ